VLREGNEIALLSIGPVGNDAAWAAEQMVAEGVSVLHADLRFAKPLDEKLLHRIGREFSQVVTVEDGVIEGGVGEAVLAFFNTHGYSCRVTSLGIQDRFIPHGTVDQLKAMCGYDRQGILQTLRKVHSMAHETSEQN
jgi:1-deoxy-D-xylulose-5-phosphate synthase